MNQYLHACSVIDWRHPDVLATAKTLTKHNYNEAQIVRSCFEYVRDEIQHSWDFKRDETTCSASDVLHYKTGWCYAKSHLLAALLRVNSIPAGLCYQRLTIEGDQGPYCLHGLNAVYLKKYGWYRMDARGNNDIVHAEFSPPVERLAYPVTHPDEADITGVWPQPLPVVINVLRDSQSCQQVRDQLPDIELF